ncbi:M28 family metallopeptidase [Halolamina pelagica]|uniref:M28 family metallopeptidase n=1 Tax=Halolamina pelagica TaxID=699431 RepID=UPI001EFBC6CF|nr:M28 family peptidase [Halolamina pelagica]
MTTDWMACPIVEARIEAGDADPEDDDFVLLHGHYDSWAVGIADNATGDAGLLELARVFDEHSDDLQRDLRVAWWPGHSTGRYAGSTWYADEFAMDLVEDCVAHVDMDSPGAKGSTEYVDMACWMPEMHGVVSSAIEDATGAPYSENRPRRAGDYSFNNLGLSGAFTLSSNIPADVRETMRWHTVGGCGATRTRGTSAPTRSTRRANPNWCATSGCTRCWSRGCSARTCSRTTTPATSSATDRSSPTTTTSRARRSTSGRRSTPSTTWPTPSTRSTTPSRRARSTPRPPTRRSRRSRER